MKTFKATITKQDGSELLTDIYVRIGETDGDIKSWHGSFVVRKKPVELGQHTISLDDGRGGDILINGMSDSSAGETRVTFAGTGALS